MAYAPDVFASDGTTTDFTVSWPFIAKAHVDVFVDGVEQTLGTDYSWLNDTTIQFDTAPADGTTIRIERNTPTERLVDFQDAGTITEKSLDLDGTQSVFVAEETNSDLTEDAMLLDNDDKFDAKSKVIKNVADGSVDTDVPNLKTMNAKVDEAATSATNAATSETNAADSETNAATSETNAADSETKAQEWAEKAEDSEVETNKFSALHWAAKAAASADSIDSTPYTETLLDDPDAPTARATLGLGSAAVEDIGTSGSVVPKLDQNVTFSANVDLEDSVLISKRTSDVNANVFVARDSAGNDIAGLSVEGMNGAGTGFARFKSADKWVFTGGSGVTIGTTNLAPAINNFVGISAESNGLFETSRDGGASIVINRKTNDGELTQFRQDGSVEGTISVSGTTVSYNGGHLGRWSQLPGLERDPAIKRGTLMSSADEMAEWYFIRRKESGAQQFAPKDTRPGQFWKGQPVEAEDNEQLVKTVVSSTPGDKRVYCVFDRWDDDEDPDNPDEWDADFVGAAVGDFVVRVTGPCEAGDLLESNGDGTARVQSDDIVRSKTVGKVSKGFPSARPDEENTVPCQLLIG